MPLTVGVLIIGSLYWRNEGRERWRECRLEKNKNYEWLVKAPIQYGRRSKNETYTMVFSSLGGAQLGQAIVVQCKREVTSASDLITEAEWLWSAEASRKGKARVPPLCNHSPEHRISPRGGDWGCVALMRNPDREIPQQLLDDWAKRVVGENKHYNANEKRLVDDRGMLQIPWPALSSDGGPVPPDLLLATSNDRDEPPPMVKEIADAWINNREGLDYFRCNRKHGIETSQDEEIDVLLQRA